MAFITEVNYRHKKFDLSRRQHHHQQEQNICNDSVDNWDEVKIKQELIRRSAGTTATATASCSNDSSKSSNYQTDEETSNCSSDFSLAFQLKRRRLESSTPIKKRPRLAEDSGLVMDMDSLHKCESIESELQSRLSSTSASGSSSSQHRHTQPSLPFQLPTAITADVFQDICKYHGNMVRKFPKKDRSPKDQERRNKNTVACRRSRRVKKLEHLAIEEQYKEFSVQHVNIVEQYLRSTAYLNHINQLIQPADQPKINLIASPAKKNFNIEFLIGDGKL